MAIKDIYNLLRPHQWVKNLFVFIPLFFGKGFTNYEDFFKSFIAFIIFSSLASSIYCLNDLVDANVDKLHPKKKNRPIASGKISRKIALFIIVILFSISLVLTMFFFGDNYPIFSIVLFYFLMNICYSLYLKYIPLVDVSIVALGFVLRVLMGGLAVNITISSWLVLMTFLLALFLVFAKRRDDLVIYEETGIVTRKNINRYTLHFVDQILPMIATITIVCYIMYTVSDEVVVRFNSNYLYTTSLWVILGILRYLMITIVDKKSGSPTKVMLHDSFIIGCVFAWLFHFAYFIYF